MELTDLTKFVMTLVLIGMLIGIGMVVFSGFGTSSGVWMTASVTSESFAWPQLYANATTVNPRISVSAIKNVSGSALTVDTHYDVQSALGRIRNLANSSTCTEGDTCYVDYTWQDRSPKVSEALSNVTSSVGSLATNWLSIIVIVVVCALILGIVMRSFVGRR